MVVTISGTPMPRTLHMPRWMKAAHTNHGASFRYTQRPKCRECAQGAPKLFPDTTDTMEIVAGAAAAADSAADAAAADSAAYAAAASAAAADQRP